MAEYKRAGISCPYCGNDLYVDFDLCPNCGKDVPASLLQLIQSMHSSAHTVPEKPMAEQPSHESSESSLPHFKELEEDSKTKIGTFERLHNEYQSKKYGFDDTDYAPLISLLSSVLELELSYAIYYKFQDYWKSLAEIDTDLNLPKSRELCSLGTMNKLIETANGSNEDYLPEGCRKDWDFAKEKFLYRLKENMPTFVKFRNKAAHKDTISEGEFIAFYEKYQPFYTQFMPHILTLKASGDSAGYRLFIDMRKDFPTF